MSRPDTFSAVVETWPGGRKGLSADLRLSIGTIRKWSERDWIPPEYWHDIVQHACRVGVEVTAEVLTAMAARRLFSGSGRRSKKEKSPGDNQGSFPIRRGEFATHPRKSKGDTDVSTGSALSAQAAI